MNNGFKSWATYLTEDNTPVRILVNADNIEGYTFCLCCRREARHLFNTEGDSLCNGKECQHGNLVKLVDTNMETYRIRAEKV